MRIFFSIVFLTTLLFTRGLTASLGAMPLSDADSITVAVEPHYDQVSTTHRFWLGENYRKLWATPVKMRILRLSKEKGGLSIVKTGGGMQTRSLRLKDSSGREWVLRTIQKYPERGLPVNLRPTIAKDILQDQVSTGHPYGALVVPPLAEALGLPHANPEVVYVEDDPSLGTYRKDFANAVYLFEERNPDEAAKTDNTEKVQRKLEKDNDVRVTQKMVLRARLLDFLVGDWDRHEDNWRWLPEKMKGETIYSPIPRDRDKVFYKTTGVFPWILSHQWLKSNLQPYGDDIRDIAGWNYNARYFDRYFLNALDESDWLSEVEYVKKTIADDLIENSIRRMPDTIYSLNGTELVGAFKARRNNLNKIALEYYHFISKVVDIPLSESSELIYLDYTKGAMVGLSVFNKKKDGLKGRLLYHRIFSPAVTREVRIYGIGGDDEYHAEGGNKSKIKVRLIGGTEADRFFAGEDFVNNHLYIYDHPKSGNLFPAASSARLRLSADSTVNSFDRRNFKYDRFGPMALVNYNIDQGIQLRGGLIYEKQGFRKDPFAVKHELWVNYSTGRNSWLLNYEGIFTHLIGKNDLSLHVDSWGPNNVSNFFGLGNETEFLRHDAGGIGYYRNRYDYITSSVRLNRNISSRLRVNAGIGGEFYFSDPENNTFRFFNRFNVANPDENVFGDKVFAGVVGGIKYDSRNSTSTPSAGVFWNTNFTFKQQLNGSNNYARLESDFSLFLNLADSNLVIANRIGGGTTIGDPAFFQQMQLGGVRSLRGLHTNRFTGKTSVYHNLDLRLKLFHFTSWLLPGTVGLIGFHDTGRVWIPGEHSETWHHGYGGGLYIVPAELIVIQGSVGFSKEGSLPYISIGYSF